MSVLIREEGFLAMSKTESETDHRAALEALDEALGDGGTDADDESTDDETEWAKLKAELEKDRLSGRGLFSRKPQ